MQIFFMLTQVLPVVCHNAVKGYNEKVWLHSRKLLYLYLFIILITVFDISTETWRCFLRIRL
jgi:hypothetical protein